MKQQLKLNIMKRNILINAAAILCLALLSCSINMDGETLGGETVKGNGNIVTRNYEVTDFDEISTSLSATVNFTVSNDYTCRVRVDENLLEYLDIKVKGHELILKRQNELKNVTLRATEFVIEVSAPRLEEINLAGSGTLNVLSRMEAEELEVNVAGSGDVYFKEPLIVGDLELNVAGSGNIDCDVLEADQLDANVAGSGDLKVDSGTVREAEAGVAGSGDIVLLCDIVNLEANIAGSGDIKARVRSKLTYGIFGSGDIGYYGNPVVEGNKVGASRVNRLGD